MKKLQKYINKNFKGDDFHLRKTARGYYLVKQVTFNSEYYGAKSDKYKTIFSAKSLEEIQVFLKGFKKSKESLYDPLRKYWLEENGKKRSLEIPFIERFDSIGESTNSEGDKQRLYEDFFKEYFKNMLSVMPRMFRKCTAFNEDINGWVFKK